MWKIGVIKFNMWCALINCNNKFKENKKYFQKLSLTVKSQLTHWIIADRVKSGLFKIYFYPNKGILFYFLFL